MRLNAYRPRKAMPDEHEAGVVNGPTWCVHWYSAAAKHGGPRIRIDGRWLGAQWAWHVRARTHRICGNPRKSRAGRLKALRIRIDSRLGRYAHIPF